MTEDEIELDCNECFWSKTVKSESEALGRAADHHEHTGHQDVESDPDVFSGDEVEAE